MNIRSTLFTLFYLFTVFSFGQDFTNLDGYKYVYVPTLKYNDGSIDKWRLSEYARECFKLMGFNVLTENSNAPDELKNDPCLLLNCKITNSTATVGSNTVTVTCSNCRNQVVLEKTGSGMGMTLYDDYGKAFLKIGKQLSQIRYSFNPRYTPEMDLPIVEKTSETEQSLKTYLSSGKLEIIEGIYKSSQGDGMPYYKFGIIRSNEKFKAIIIESDQKQWKPGEVKAFFEPSSMKGIYSVKWYMGDKTSFETFCNMENAGLLTIELKDRTGGKQQDTFIKMFPSISSVNAKPDESKASGSGFFITTDGIIGTNAHLIENANIITVMLSNEIGTFEYSAKVLLSDRNNDVALLKISDAKFMGLAVLPFTLVENADVGEKVFTIGYPLNDIMGSNFKVTDGIISSKTGISDDIRFYQITVPLQPGNSGGPLFNKSGNLIGITTSKLNSQAVGTEVQNVNYAVKIAYLINLFRMLPENQKLNTISTLSGKELQEQVKILKNYVCLIKVNQ